MLSATCVRKRVSLTVVQLHVQKEASKRENKQQQKLSSQLGKIQKIMEEKGHGHANAFKEGGGRVVGSTNGEASMPAKKRRI